MEEGGCGEKALVHYVHVHSYVRACARAHICMHACLHLGANSNGTIQFSVVCGLLLDLLIYMYRSKCSIKNPNTKRFKQMLMYFDADTQYAHFQGTRHCHADNLPNTEQVTKPHPSTKTSFSLSLSVLRF